MKLLKARVKGYRSIIDLGFFDIEKMKTIFIGPNEAGKTALLQALQKINPPNGTPLFDILRDYPRSRYAEDIPTRKVDPSRFSVVEGHFILVDDEKEEMVDGFKDAVYIFGRYLDNKTYHRIEKGINPKKFAEISKDLHKISLHMDERFKKASNDLKMPSIELQELISIYSDNIIIDMGISGILENWLNSKLSLVDESNESEVKRFDKLMLALSIVKNANVALQQFYKLLPTFVLFNNYFRVKPSIHLEHLAYRTEHNILDDKYYDYGNNCLLKLLGFTARDLSNLGKVQAADYNDFDALKKYKDQLDKRTYLLNAASVRLTKEIKKIWNPNPEKPEANQLKIQTDGQYLKVVVDDELGVDIELDQRSEGYQWLVSFFVVFFSEAEDKHKNAILLLDEPGLSLHGLKQAQFRETVSRLSEKNQTIYTTHSPFLVGADELDLVRVIEMADRNIGTLVHTSITASDSAAILPLQEALGYDLAQTLFINKKNLILEGLTDYWYIEAIINLLEENGVLTLTSIFQCYQRQALVKWSIMQQYFMQII